MAYSARRLSGTVALALGLTLVLGFGFAPGGRSLAQTAAEGTVDQQRWNESFRIGPGDVVQVDVLDEPDLAQSVRVNDAGEAAVNLLGKVPIAGLTPFETGDLLRRRYIAAGLLNNPQVSVTALRSFHQTVSVVGEVGRPGAVELASPRTLLDVISLAGGFTGSADRHITIRRKNSASDIQTVFLPNQGTEAVANGAVLIYPGDAIVVPRAGIVYVLGDVGHPGGYVMQNDSRMTLLQAIATAGGAPPNAAERRVRILHQTAAGIEEKTISLSAYERGKLPDFALQKDDVVYVPFSYSRNIAIGAGSILAGTGSALIYSIP